MNRSFLSSRQLSITEVLMIIVSSGYTEIDIGVAKNVHVYLSLTDELVLRCAYVVQLRAMKEIRYVVKLLKES